MPRVWLDKNSFTHGESVIVHYEGFPSNTSLGVAWIDENGNIYNYPYVGQFKSSSSGSGEVMITTSQGGKELVDGRYKVKMWVWNNPSVYAESGWITISTSAGGGQPPPTPPTPPTPPPSPLQNYLPWIIGVAVLVPLAGVTIYALTKK